MNSLFKKIKKKFKNAIEFNFYSVDKKIVLHKQALAGLLNVSSRTISSYEAKGLEKWENAPSNLPMYDLKKAIEWYKKNINKKYSPTKTSKNSPSTTYGINLENFLNSLPAYKREIFEISELDSMEKLKALRDIEKKEISNKKERGELISKDDVDKNMASVGGLLMASLINYEKSAPAELAMKSKKEIQKLIKNAHFDVADNLNELVNRHFECDETFYNIMAVALEHIQKGATPKEIIDKISSANDTA